MNSSIYVFGDFGRGLTQYPNDYTHTIFAQMLAEASAPSQIAIHRDGVLMYYAYIRLLEEGKTFGICFVTHGLAISNPRSLFRIFETLFEELVLSGIIIKLSPDGDYVPAVTEILQDERHIPTISQRVERLVSKISTCSLPPVDYSKSKDSLVYHSVDDNYKEVFKSTVSEGYVLIYKKDDYESSKMRSYKSTLYHMQQDQYALHERVDQLVEECGRLRNEKRNLRWVAIIGAVAIVLGIVVWNNVLFPSEVTHMVMKDFVYYGPLDSSRKPHGVGVAIYHENDSNGRRYYVGNFSHGHRADSAAMLLYRNGNYYYGAWDEDGWKEGIMFNYEDNSHYEGTFKDYQPHTGTQYIHEEAFKFNEGSRK